jgi:hypothetical protein
MKIRPVGAELFHAGGQTDATKPIVAFRNFANAPKNAYKMLFNVKERNHMEDLDIDVKITLNLILNDI